MNIPNTPQQQRMPGTPDSVINKTAFTRDAQGRYWNPYAKCWELSAEENLAVVNWVIGIQSLARKL